MIGLSRLYRDNLFSSKAIQRHKLDFAKERNRIRSKGSSIDGLEGNNGNPRFSVNKVRAGNGVMSFSLCHRPTPDVTEPKFIPIKSNM